MRTLFFSLLLIASCRSGEDSKETGAVDSGDSQVDTQVEHVDADGDGFTDETDCDDADVGVNPDAVESCDGIDNDCDGLIDDADESVTGLSTWYADVDGDGYGNGGSSQEACEAPGGFVADDTDCDDLDAEFHPAAAESDCTDENDYNCDGSVGYDDADGDGFAACEDCDDAVASSNPLAFEVCDSVDNNCDGDIDEDSAVDSTTWYADADGDGYGDAATSTEACEAPSAYVADDTDCNDAEADIHPSAVEVCDSTDNDCDGWVDDTDPDVTGTTVFYFDADGDGYGGQQLQVSACVSPNGYVATSNDCDDLDASSYPGASETCDLADNDCDGDVDEGVGTTWYEDADGDGFGNANVSVQACQAPPGYVTYALDCDDANAATNPSSYEVCDTVDNDCDGTADEDAINAATFYSDADGDGYGTAALTTTACSSPSNYAATSGDCNDSDPTVSPGAVEGCDGFDNDCDGAVDEADSFNASTWYADGDGDGYGDASSPTQSCTPPVGYVADSSDCDDADGASTNTTVDADCDGALTADDCDDSDAASTTVATDGDCDGALTADDCDDSDAASTTVATDGDCDGALTAADCNDADASAYPGNQETCDGVDNDCDGTVDGAPVQGNGASCAATSCQSILTGRPGTADGSYWLDPSSSGSFLAYCDMTTDGGGWTRVGLEQIGYQGTLKYLGVEVGSTADIESGTGNGLIGARFWSHYTEVRVSWSNSSVDQYIQFTPSGAVFVNTLDTSMAVSNFSTNNSTLNSWVSGAGGAQFCRASRSTDVRPGDTSWAIKDVGDTYTQCGCNSGGWTGKGAYYGGVSGPTFCGNHGGGWAAVRSNGQQKGSIVSYQTTLWVR